MLSLAIYYKINQPIKFLKATLKHCNTAIVNGHIRAAKKVGVSEPRLKNKNKLNVDVSLRDISQYLLMDFGLQTNIYWYVS